MGTWDRALVASSSKISTLYGRCFQAERDCGEVERQLSGVETAQRDLDALLDKYENEVDRLLEGRGELSAGAASGVDLERERTYVSTISPIPRLSANIL